MECLLYVEINLLCITTLAIMIYKVLRVGADASVKRRTFVLSMLFALLMNIFDILWELGLTKVLPFPPLAMHIVNLLYFLAAAGMSLCFYLFCDTVQGRTGLYRDATFRLYAVLPVILLCALAVASCFSDAFFLYFDENGDYCRGPLFYLQHILAFGYVIVASVKNFVCVVSRRTFAQKGEFSILFSFVVPPVVCGVLQCVFQRLPVLTAAPIVSFMLIYTSSLQSQLSLDPLTGIYNRRQILLTLSDRMHNLPKNRDLYFLFVDVNAFKAINDTYGHYAGDRILQRVADALQSVCAESKGVCGRYGGDEFVIIQELPNEGGVERLIDECEERIRERCSTVVPEAGPMRVSIGWARYDRQTDDLPALVARADRRMYEQKAQAKKRRAPGV